MKTSQKVALVTSAIILLTFTTFSWVQYYAVSDTLFQKTEKSSHETMVVLKDQVSSWLSSKLQIIEMSRNFLHSHYDMENVMRVVNLPLLKEQFDLVYISSAETGRARFNNPDLDAKLIDFDSRSRPWYVQGKTQTHSSFTPTYQDVSSGNNKIVFSAFAGLHGANGFNGVIGADLNLDIVSKAINSIDFNQSGYAFLINSKGKIISHPNLELNGKYLKDIYTNTQPELSSDLQSLNITGDINVFSAFHQLEGLPGADWYIGIILEEDKVMADVHAFGVRAIIMTALSALFCCVIIYFTVSRQLLPLHKLHHSLIDINSGDGDLTKRLEITSNDEFGEVSADFNHFLSYLQGLIQQIKNISGQIRENSDLNASYSENSAKSATGQLNLLDSLAVSMKEMSTTAQDVARSMVNTAAAVKSADEASQRGAEVFTRAADSVDLLSNEINNAVDIINELVNYSDNIESILTVITGITEQTNLLALNASIEAARAGEQGRGFAVVADEVRALASRSQESANEIKEMITQLQSGAGKAKNVMNSSREKAVETNELTQEAHKDLEMIMDNIRQIEGMTIQIATAAEQQSATTEEINTNTLNIRDMGQSISEQANQQHELFKATADLTAEQDQALGKFIS